MPRCYLALGGNQGDVAATFDRALRLLSLAPDLRVVQVSRFIETAPVGVEQPRFLNAVAELDTTLPSADLFALTQRIEDDCGRVRSVRWGPRTLDLDLILYGRDVIDTPNLKVPHPACWYRRFVLDPLVEIAPDAFHPIKQMTAIALRNRLLVRPFHLSIAGESDTARAADLILQLRLDFPDVVFSIWEQLESRPSTNPEPTLIVWLGGLRKSPAGSATSEAFDNLPLAARLDATGSSEPAPVFLRHVLQAALGR